MTAEGGLANAHDGHRAGVTVRCPVHDDRAPSLSISSRSEGLTDQGSE